MTKYPRGMLRFAAKFARKMSADTGQDVTTQDVLDRIDMAVTGEGDLEEVRRTQRIAMEAGFYDEPRK